MFKVISQYTMRRPNGRIRTVVDIRCECGNTVKGMIKHNFNPERRCLVCNPRKSKEQLAEEAREYNIAYQARLREKRKLLEKPKKADTIETTFVHRGYTLSELEMISQFKPKKIVGVRELMKPAETIRFTDKGKPDTIVTTFKPVMTVVVHEYDFREISEALDISYEEAKSVYLSGMKKLRNLLDEDVMDTVYELYG